MRSKQEKEKNDSSYRPAPSLVIDWVAVIIAFCSLIASAFLTFQTKNEARAQKEQYITINELILKRLDRIEHKIDEWYK